MVTPQRRKEDTPLYQWLSLAIALLVVVCVVGLSLYFDYQSVDVLERERLATQAKLIDRNLGQQLSATSLALDAIRRDIPALMAQRDGVSQLNRQLNAVSEGMPGVRTLIYLDAAGIAVASDREQLIGRGFSQRKYFQVPRQGGDPAALYVTPPFKTSLGVYAMNVSKVVADGRGAFAGVVTATLDPEYFMTLLDSVRYADDVWAALTHGDGKLFLMAPPHPGIEGADLFRPGSFFSRHRESGRLDSVMTGVAAADGVVSMMAQRTIQPKALAMDKPLLLAVRRDLSKLFADWRRSAYLHGAAVALLALVATLSLFWHQQRQRAALLLVSSIDAEREKAEIALFESDAQLGMALAATQIGLWDWDIRNDLWRASSAYFSMLGDAIETGAYAQSAWLDRVHPDDRQQVEATIDVALYDSDAPFQYEARMRHADGSYRWLAVQGKVVERDATENAVRMRGARIDITERKRTEEALEQSESRWRFALEGAGDGVWDWNLQNGEAFFSKRYKAMLGYAEDEIGTSADEWSSRVHPEDMPNTMKILQDYLDGLTPAIEIEFRMRCKDGSWKWVHGRGMLVSRDAAGKPVRVIGTNTDITARKNAEQELRQYRDHLETLVAERTRQLESTMDSLLDARDALLQSEAKATLSTLIASVTHELSTPIGNSVLTAGTLKDRSKDFQQIVAAGKTKRSDLAAFIAAMDDGAALLHRNLWRAQELLGHFKQVAADQASERRREFDLAVELKEVVATLTPSLKHQPHRIVVDVPDGIAMDSLPGPLGQVVINLINNAYLHAFDGRNDGVVTIGAAEQGDHVRLCCTDNGVGIAEEDLANIFKPFFSTKIGRGGTGLGMSIIENLVVKTLCGTLQVRSTPNVGTTVELILPRALPPADSPLTDAV